MSSAKEQRQAEYLRIVSETGSLVQARRRIGVTSKTIANWRLDPDFVEAVQDALDVANDAIRAKVREIALAGETSMLALSMKVIEPVLRPQSAVTVGLGVRVGSSVEDRRAARISAMSDDELVAEVKRILGDAQMRIEARPQLQGPIVDAEVVEPLSAPSEGRWMPPTT
jgi:hypothetical protein